MINVTLIVESVIILMPSAIALLVWQLINILTVLDFAMLLLAVQLENTLILLIICVLYVLYNNVLNVLIIVFVRHVLQVIILIK